MSAEVQVALLEVGDVAVFVDGDQPFEVAAVSEVVDHLRLLDLVATPGGRTRVTAWAEQVVLVVDQKSSVARVEPSVVAAAS